MKRLIRLFTEEHAATAVEYAVMLALIVVMCLVGIRTLGARMLNVWVQGKADMNAAGF
ncbi:MAG: Flp family type IVb pilin [Planctomycetaceae bacterium]|nr:Flp family type IVb pilin [Planctomycetaceae bacterium]